MSAQAMTSTIPPATAWSRVQRWVDALRARVGTLRPVRNLRVCEAVPLGDKRFVAVVQFECKRFLIGGAANSVVLLSRLDDTHATSFSEALAVVKQGHA